MVQKEQEVFLRLLIYWYADNLTLKCRYAFMFPLLVPYGCSVYVKKAYLSWFPECCFLYLYLWYLIVFQINYVILELSCYSKKISGFSHVMIMLSLSFVQSLDLLLSTWCVLRFKIF